MLHTDWQWACVPSGWPGSGSYRKVGQPVSLLSHSPALRGGDKESICFIVTLGTWEERSEPFQVGASQSSLLCRPDLLEEWWEKGGSTSGRGERASLSRGIVHNSPPLSFGNHNIFACMRTTSSNGSNLSEGRPGWKARGFLALGLMFPVVFQDGVSSQLQSVGTWSLEMGYNASSFHSHVSLNESDGS